MSVCGTYREKLQLKLKCRCAVFVRYAGQRKFCERINMKSGTVVSVRNVLLEKISELESHRVILSVPD